MSPTGREPDLGTDWRKLAERSQEQVKELLAQRERAEAERDEARRERDNWESSWKAQCFTIQHMEAEVVVLRQERDELRRIIDVLRGEEPALVLAAILSRAERAQEGNDG